ncbi:MAG: ATP-binding cassette domain-containing protein [Mycoplasmoidaceae bacterium]
MNKKIIKIIKKIYQINDEKISDELLSKISKQVTKNFTWFDVEKSLDKSNIKYFYMPNLNQLESKKIYVSYFIDKNNNHVLKLFYYENNKIIFETDSDFNSEIKIDDFKKFNIEKIWEIKGIDWEKKAIFNGLDKIKYQMNIIFIIVDLIVIFLVIINSFYFKIVLDLIVPENNIDLLIKASILFLIFFLISITLEQLIFFVKKKLFNQFWKKYYFRLIDYINGLQLKSDNDLDYNQYRNYINSVKIVFNFLIFSIPNGVTAFINFFIITIIICFLNQYFIFIEIILAGGILLFNFMKVKINSINSIRKIRLENEIESNSNKYFHFKKGENNQFIFKKYKNKFLSLIDDFQNNDVEWNIKIKKIEHFDSIFKRIFIMLFTTIFIFLIIIGDSNIPISTLIFIMTLMTTLLKSFEDIFLTVIDIPQYLFFKKYFNDFQNFSHKNPSYNIKKIFSIEYQKSLIKIEDNIIFKNININFKNGTLIFGQSGIGKTTLVKSILNKNLGNNIYINNINQNFISEQWLNNNVVYYTGKFDENILETQDIIYGNHEFTKEIMLFIKKYKINLSDFNSLSTGQKQIIKFLTLLNFKNKILILDEPLSNLNTELKFKIINLFKKDLMKNNFLIWVTHDLHLTRLFDNKMELKKCKNI